MSGAGKSTPLRGADHVAAPRVAPANLGPADPAVGVDRVAVKRLVRLMAEAFAPDPARIAAYLNSDEGLGVARY